MSAEANKAIVRQWLDEGHLACKGGTYPAQLMYKALADLACERITAAIVRAETANARPVQAVLDPYNPVGSTRHLSFTTTRNNALRFLNGHFKMIGLRVNGKPQQRA